MKIFALFIAFVGLLTAGTTAKLFERGISRKGEAPNSLIRLVTSLAKNEFPFKFRGSQKRIVLVLKNDHEQALSPLDDEVEQSSGFQNVGGGLITSLATSLQGRINGSLTK